MVDFGTYGPKMDLEDEGGMWQVVLDCNDGGGGTAENFLMERWEDEMMGLEMCLDMGWVVPTPLGDEPLDM